MLSTDISREGAWSYSSRSVEGREFATRCALAQRGPARAWRQQRLHACCHPPRPVQLQHAVASRNSLLHTLLQRPAAPTCQQRGVGTAPGAPGAHWGAICRPIMPVASDAGPSMRKPRKAYSPNAGATRSTQQASGMRSPPHAGWPRQDCNIARRSTSTPRTMCLSRALRRMLTVVQAGPLSARKRGRARAARQGARAHRRAAPARGAAARRAAT